MAFARRSLLYVPGSEQRKCEKAFTVDCDCIIFDLEDAVAPNKKEFARENICNLLKSIKENEKELIVRVNQPSSLVGLEDLKMILPYNPDAIIITKASEREVVIADTYIHAFQAEASLIPLIETVYGLVNLKEILQCSDKITGVQLGAEDLTKDLGIKRTSGGSELAFVRSQLTFIARSFGLDVIDTPYVDFKDLDGLKKDLDYIRSIGMTAKTAIHPSQIEVINKAFSYSDEEIAEAKAIVDAFDHAVKNGLGAVSFNGQMIDAPVAKRAADILERAGIKS